MEAKGHGQRWTTRLPEFKHRRRFTDPTAEDGERGETEREREGGGQTHRSVMMAPKSRFLTDRQYVKRTPLFSTEQCTSILKKTQPVEQEKQDENQQHPDMSFLTRAGSEPTPESFSLSHSDASSPSASGRDLGSPLSASELRSSLCYEEPSVRRSAQRSLLSSILEVQKLNPPMRPRLTSTVLYPTYTHRSGSSRTGRTQLRQGGRVGEGGEENKRCSGGQSTVCRMSPHQANYWACAIPKALPPSPDRLSSSWDANREYQALLDYTYPLRPGQVVTEWDGSKLKGDSRLPTDPNLQDSGIGLDHLCSSTSLSGLGFTVSSTEQSRERSSLIGGQRSPDSSEGLPSRALLSHTEPVGLSLDRLDRGGMNHHKSDGHLHQHHALSSSSSSSSSPAFIRSTSVLPRSRCVGGEVDEEFRSLPEQLEELQLLSRQVREVTAQLSRPLTASWESVGPGITSILSSITLPERQEAEAKEPEGSSDDTDQTGREMSAAQTAAIYRDSKAVRRSSGARMEAVGGGVNQSSLGEVQALAEQLCGLTLPGSQGSSQENQEQSDSLMQHIQVFSSHLEQLIQQLYAVLERMELLAVPSVDIDSVKSSLAEYQSFQREVSSHQPLTSSVLHTGQLLLSCINTTSPFLRDTLLLIERQSGSLETHTEHFFSSILSAMDSLTRLKPVQQSREEEPEVQASTL